MELKFLLVAGNVKGMYYVLSPIWDFPCIISLEFSLDSVIRLIFLFGFQGVIKLIISG